MALVIFTGPPIPDEADPPAVTDEKPPEPFNDRELDETLKDEPTETLRSGLVGSSKHGGGKTGLAGALPLPEGPPPPTRRRDPPDCC